MNHDLAMKKTRDITLSVACLLIVFSSCEKNDRSSPTLSAESTILATMKPARQNMNITIGTKLFSVTLNDNPTTAKLIDLLPLTLEMSEFNGNEKFFQLSSPLPTDETKPGTIQTGDLMLYGNDSLVLFYKSFTSSYSYTRIGRIDEPAGLEAAVGTGNISVQFELK